MSMLICRLANIGYLSYTTKNMLCLIPNKDDELSLAILQKKICIELNRKNIIFLPLYPLWVKFFIQYDSLLKKNIKNILVKNLEIIKISKENNFSTTDFLTHIQEKNEYLTIPIILELLDSKTIDGKIILGKLKASDENSSTLNTFILQFLQDKKIANFRTFRIANATFYDDISWQVEKSYWVKLHS